MILACPLCGCEQFEEHEFVLTLHPAWFEGDSFQLDGEIGSEVVWDAAKDATIECAACGAVVELVGEGTDEPRLIVGAEAALAWLRVEMDRPMRGPERCRERRLVGVVLEATRR